MHQYIRNKIALGQLQKVWLVISQEGLFQQFEAHIFFILTVFSLYNLCYII